MLADRSGNYITPKDHVHILASATASAFSANGSIGEDGKAPNRLTDSTGVVAGLVFFYTIVALTALISNILILIVVIRRLVTRNTVNIFLSSLAFSDLIMVLLSLLDCLAFMQGGWLYGEWLCKVQSYFLEISFTASTLTLVAVSCERYLLICHPHMKRRSIQAIYHILFGVWISAMVICSPLLHGYVVYEDRNTVDKTVEYVCANKAWGDKYILLFYSLYSVITYVIPLFIMGFAHWRISLSVKDNNVRRPSTAQSTLQSEEKPNVCFTIREESSGASDHTNGSLDHKGKTNGVHKALLNSISSLKRRGTNSLGERDLNRREKRMKAIRLLFVVTVTFLMLWSPFTIMRLLLSAGVSIPDYAYKLTEILIFSSTAVNGFIYAFMSLPFRKAFKALLCCRTRSELVSRDSGPSMSNSEDNRLMNNRMSSRGSVSYNVESRNGSLSHSKALQCNGTKACV